MIDYARISHMLAYEQSGVWPLNVTPVDPTTKSVFRRGTRGWEYPWVLYLEAAGLANGLLANLKSPLQGSLKGLCPVVSDYRGARASAELALPDPYRVKPRDAFLESLAEVVGRDAVALDYGGSGSLLFRLLYRSAASRKRPKAFSLTAIKSV